jgi:hypothetical protein
VTRNSPFGAITIYWHLRGHSKASYNTLIFSPKKLFFFLSSIHPSFTHVFNTKGNITTNSLRLNLNNLKTKRPEWNTIASIIYFNVHTLRTHLHLLQLN